MKATALLDRLKTGSLWSLLARISGSLSALIVSIILARLLTVEALGAFFLFLQILTFSSWFAKMGMSGSLQKVLGIASEVADWQAVRTYMQIAALTLLLATVLLIVAFYPSWGWFTQSFLNAPILTGSVAMILMAIPLRALEELASAFFCGIHEPRIGVFLLDVPRQSLLMLTLGLLLLLAGNVGFNVTLWIYFAASGSSVLLSLYLARRWLRSRPVAAIRPATLGNTVAFWRLSFPMFLQSGAGLLMSSSDIWILGVYTKPHDVAIYGAVIRLASLMIFALNIVNLVIPPMLAVLHEKNDRDGLEQLLRTTAGWSVYVVMPVLFVFLLWGGDVLALIFGEPFRDGRFVLAAFAIAHAINALSGSPGMLMQMTGYHYKLMRLTMFWAAFSVVMNLFSVKVWGMDGVAVTTGLSIIGMNINMAYFAKNCLQVKTWARLPTLFRKPI